MTWFKHIHYWRTIKNDTIINDNKISIGAIVLEKCSCGAIRTIEYKPGSTPIIRIGIETK